jgi:lactate permease
VPFWIIWTMAGRKAMLEVWPACLTAGASFAICQFLVSNYHGPWLVDIAGAIISMVCTVILLKFWQPKTLWRYEHEREIAHEDIPNHSTGKVVRAWMPWVLLSLFVFAWGTPAVKNALNGGTKAQPNFMYGIAKRDFEIPYLHKAVTKTPPVVAKASVEPAVYTLNWLSATGTSLLLAGIVGGLLVGYGPWQLFKIWLNTIKRVKISLLTIAAMLALGFCTKSAGLDATMGLAFAATGAVFPFFSAMLGWLGVALTGSDTSSNVLFGGLQKITAQQLGLNPIMTAAANTCGGVMGKMIDAQSLVVASVATHQEGQEGTILRYVFFHSIILAALVGCVIMLYAKVLPANWMPQVPAPAAPVVSVAAPAPAVAAPVATPVK